MENWLWKGCELRREMENKSHQAILEYKHQTLLRATKAITGVLESLNLVPNNLKEIRQARGLTQLQLAEKIGVKYCTISSYEAGKVDPPPTQLEKIANVLGCPVDYFFLKSEKA